MSRALSRPRPVPRYIPQILAASGCALLFLSGVMGIASMVAWRLM